MLIQPRRGGLFVPEPSYNLGHGFSLKVLHLVSHLTTTQVPFAQPNYNIRHWNWKFLLQSILERSLVLFSERSHSIDFPKLFIAARIAYPHDLQITDFPLGKCFPDTLSRATWLWETTSAGLCRIETSYCLSSRSLGLRRSTSRTMQY